MNELQLHTLLEQAARYQDEGKMLHALQVLHAILRDDPTCDKAYVRLSQLYIEMDRNDLAEKTLLNGSRVNRGNLEYDFLLGTLHLRQARFDKALSYFGNLKHLNIPQIHQSIGIIYLHQNNLQGAEEELRKAVVGDPDLPKVHELLAEVFLKAGKYQDAETVLHFALTRNPYSGYAHRLLGHVRLALQDFRMAYDSFVQAIDCDPEDADAWCACGCVLVQLERHGEAQAYLERACQINPHNVAAWIALGRVHILLGDKRKAHDMLLVALKVQPGNAEALQLKLTLSN